MNRGIKYSQVRSKRRLKILEMMRRIRSGMLLGSFCKIGTGSHFWAVCK
jgi:hypothetical protein